MRRVGSTMGCDREIMGSTLFWHAAAQQLWTSCWTTLCPFYKQYNLAPVNARWSSVHYQHYHLWTKAMVKDAILIAVVNAFVCNVCWARIFAKRRHDTVGRQMSPKSARSHGGSRPSSLDPHESASQAPSLSVSSFCTAHPYTQHTQTNRPHRQTNRQTDHTIWDTCTNRPQFARVLFFTKNNSWRMLKQTCDRLYVFPVAPSTASQRWLIVSFTKFSNTHC